VLNANPHPVFRAEGLFEEHAEMGPMRVAVTPALAEETAGGA
jgi:hypothetical protein